MNPAIAQGLDSGYLDRADAALGAWVARAFPDAAPEAALAAALAARAVDDGHSALELAHAQAWLGGFAAFGEPPALPEPSAWVDALRASAGACAVAGDAAAMARTPLVLDAQGRVYLRRYFEYERRLAAALVRRARVEIPAPRDSRDIGAAMDDGVDPGQRRAVAIALSRRLALVTGGPGTGKTHTVARILDALLRQAAAAGAELRIALAAPTGKAAARLRESVLAQAGRLGLPGTLAAQVAANAGTVHKLIGLSPWRAEPRFDAASPLPFDVVIVDEVSMIDLPLMAKLIDAVPETARLVLLGDPGQLAAVEAGNVLGAMVDAAGEPPLRDCHAALTRSHRFDAGSGLGALAAAITQGDAEAALGVLAAGGASTLVDAPQPARLLEAAVAGYRAVLDADDPGGALRAMRGFRVLTALRHGPAGCTAIDAAIAGRLQRALGVRADAAWWRGRLVLVTANRPELGLFNGDTGVAWPDAGGDMKLWFDGPDGAPRALGIAALPPFEGAFALTVHKAQGSEFDRVLFVTGPESAVLTRELLYTGVTRARERLDVYGAEATLRAGIARRTLRMTGLADRMREAVPGMP